MYEYRQISVPFLKCVTLHCRYCRYYGRYLDITVDIYLRVRGLEVATTATRLELNSLSTRYTSGSSAGDSEYDDDIHFIVHYILLN